MKVKVEIDRDPPGGFSYGSQVSSAADPVFHQYLYASMPFCGEIARDIMPALG